MMYKILRDLRQKHRLTDNDMAKLIGLKTHAAYCKKELGYIPFSLKEAKIIADYFGKKIEEIFFAN